QRLDSAEKFVAADVTQLLLERHHEDVRQMRLDELEGDERVRRRTDEPDARPLDDFSHSLQPEGMPIEPHRGLLRCSLDHLLTLTNRRRLYPLWSFYRLQRGL